MTLFKAYQFKSRPFPSFPVCPSQFFHKELMRWWQPNHNWCDDHNISDNHEVLWKEKITEAMIIEEERKTLKSTLDVDLNLSQHLMSTSQVNISCQHLMSIFQLDFPFLMPSISQYLEFNIYDCYFWVGFPVSAVKYFSIFGILYLRLLFLGWISLFCCKVFLEIWNSAYTNALLSWISRFRC